MKIELDPKVEQELKMLRKKFKRQGMVKYIEKEGLYGSRPKLNTIGKIIKGPHFYNKDIWLDIKFPEMHKNSFYPRSLEPFKSIYEIMKDNLNDK